MVRAAVKVHATIAVPPHPRLEPAAIQCMLPVMARQKTIRLRALPERPAGQTPRGGASVIDVPFIDLTAPQSRGSTSAPLRQGRKKKAGAASFVVMSTLAAAIVVLAVGALFAGIAAGSPV